MLEALSIFSSAGTRKASKSAYSTKGIGSAFAIALNFLIFSTDFPVMGTPPSARGGWNNSGGEPLAVASARSSRDSKGRRACIHDI